MRILLHDYPGHPFQVQLSRALAARGHEVVHVWFTAFQSPKGALALRPGDPPGLRFLPLDIGESFAKHSFVKRLGQELRYGRVLTAAAESLRPDVVISSNCPLDPQRAFQAWARARRVPFVFWLQDLYSIAIDKILRRRLPLVGAGIGWRYRRLEGAMLRASDAVVAIAEDFRPSLAAWGVDPARVHVQENWAALDELPPRPKDNPWSRRHGLHDRPVALYSGTLGMKHNPELLAELARRLRARADARVAVISEGPGAEHLAAVKRAEGLDNLILLPFQPYADLPDAIGAADLAVAILEPEAGVFSVPSKVLTYLAAGRPILGAIPAENLAARLIAREGCGVAVPPQDLAGFAAAADRLLEDQPALAAMGRRARGYAEAAFDIRLISSRFEAIISEVCRV